MYAYNLYCKARLRFQPKYKIFLGDYSQIINIQSTWFNHEKNLREQPTFFSGYNQHF